MRLCGCGGKSSMMSREKAVLCGFFHFMGNGAPYETKALRREAHFFISMSENSRIFP